MGLTRDNYKVAFTFSMLKEGVDADDPADPGGKTRYGISSVYPPAMWENGPPSWDDAVDFYRREFWQICRCDELPSGIDIVLFDAAIPSGPGDAIRWLQRALGAKQDGLFGPKTLAAVQRARPETVIRDITAFRLQHYVPLSAYGRFGLGWFRRAIECYGLGIANINPGIKEPHDGH
ncbi:glycosyl hydrolase 108 family protein [Spongiibacter sp.]|uniref:glycoside hydrolase family 108 protein n=1 Tax=Spongiibacter sp. TaxID=2024860 RepID=UPI000C4CB7D0|nr:glycosyl hydrolase 108 family protein [Spongiibacter sp.]MBU70853.1 hypothetical protein [Spongiibacter sp.]